jgi:hypothetical protein
VLSVRNFLIKTAWVLSESKLSEKEKGKKYAMDHRKTDTSFCRWVISFWGVLASLDCLVIFDLGDVFCLE